MCRLWCLATVLGAVTACSSSTPTNFKVVTLCREDSTDHAEQAKELHKDGWRYLGPLNNNGINCTEILFGK